MGQEPILVYGIWWDDNTSYLSSTEPNWSSVDIDAPYTWCRVCTGVCKCNIQESGASDEN